MHMTFMRSKRRMILLVGVTILLLLTGLLLYKRMQPAELPAGTSQQTIVVNSYTRTYRLHIPPNLPPNKPVPLVVMLHGALGTSSQAEESYGWNDQAAEHAFMVAYPEGIKRSWEVSDNCCGPPAKENVNDVAFIQSMVEDIARTYPIDTNRIYATGISNGGSLAYRLACDTTIFAAIAPVATNMLGDCSSPAPISVLHIHGAADETFPYGGGPGKRDNNGEGERPSDTESPPVPSTIEYWRTIDQCGEPFITNEGDVAISTTACPQGRAVDLITISGAGHQWPGAKPAKPRAERLLRLDPPFMALDATNKIWDFFAQHPRQN